MSNTARRPKHWSRILAPVLTLAWLVMTVSSSFAVKRGEEAPALPGAVFTVTNTNDSGAGSLRKAINDANANAGLDTITFSIGSGAKTIAPLTALPVIAGPTLVDGTSQPSYAGTPIIELSGQNLSGAIDGLDIVAPNGGGSTIQGLVINRFPRDGIRIDTAGSNTIRGNYIGTDIAGNTDLGNANDGLFVSNSGLNLIGGTTTGARNLVSGNNVDGVRLDGSSQANRIEGNIVGLNAAGNAPLGNGFNGVVLTNGASNNTIGGTPGAARNFISANGKNGIGLGGATTSGNIIIKNFIGLDITGANNQGNYSDGILVSSAPLTRIGQSGAGNFISGNVGNGIEATTAPTLTVQFNTIGLDFPASAAVGNFNNGIYLLDSRAATIGGVWGVTGNLVSGNLHNGISLSGSGNTGLVLKGNRIGTDSTGTQDKGNGQAGILVGSPGVTIGGTGTGEENLISGNYYGIDIEGVGNVHVIGNYIGTDAAGSAAIPNYDGVEMNIAGSNTIGGTGAGEGNVISGNTGDGMYIWGSSYANNLLANYIGLNAAGTGAVPNGGNGVSVYASPRNTYIGNGTPQGRNVISGNRQDGINLSGYTLSNIAIVKGNYIGLNAAGTATVGNGNDGIEIYLNGYNPGPTIGGTNPGDRNIISGNGNGIHLSEAVYCRVINNYIGTNPAGTADMGNTGNGILISSGGDHTIGGPTAAERNIISGNNGNGILIELGQYGGTTDNDQILGNFIGTDASSSAAIANGQHGVKSTAARYGAIGTETSGTGNIIAFNTLSGVYIMTGTRIPIVGNSIYSNGALGIDLAPTGVTPNDPGDPDGGANNLQNYPVLTSTINSGGTVTINGTLNTTPNTQVRVDFYSNPVCDPSGYGEGKSYIGVVGLVTDGSGNATISTVLPMAVPVGYYITAVTTAGNGDSSEFSRCRIVTAPPTNTPTRTATRTSTRTSTATHTATRTATRTASATRTNTSTATRTNTVTRTNTPTATRTATNTPTKTATKTATRTYTPTAASTAIRTATRVPPTSTRVAATTTATKTKIPATSTRTATRTSTSTSTATPLGGGCQPVTWTNLVNATASGNNLIKPAGATAHWNSGGNSVQQLSSGDGSVQARVDNTDTLKMFGFAHNETTASYTDIDYAFYIYSDGTIASAYIYELGVNKGRYATIYPGNILKIAVEGGVVKYYRNSTLLHTSSTPPTYPLFMDASIFTPGAQIYNAIFCYAAPTTDADVRGSSGLSHPASFKDVEAGSELGSAIGNLGKKNAAIGYEDGTYRPYTQASRGQAVRMMVLALDLPINAYIESTEAPTARFSDVPADSPYYNFIEAAYRAGIAGGYADGTFRPKASLTRGGATKMVVLAAGLKPISSSTSKEKPSFSDVPASDSMYGYIEAARAAKLVSGYSDGTFRPDAAMSRGQLGMMVSAAMPMMGK